MSVRVQVPEDGVTIDTDVGLTLYVYRSKIDGKMVVELETEDDGPPTVVQHSPTGQPVMRVMLNEDTVYDGGETPNIKAENHTIEEVIEQLEGSNRVTFDGSRSVALLTRWLKNWRGARQGIDIARQVLCDDYSVSRTAVMHFKGER